MMPGLGRGAILSKANNLRECDITVVDDAVAVVVRPPGADLFVRQKKRRMHKFNTLA